MLAGYFGKVLMALQKADADAFQAYFAAAWAAAAAPEEAAAAAASEAGEEGEEAAAAAAAAATAAAAVAAGFALPKLMPRLLLHIGSDAVLQTVTTLCVGEPAAAEPGQIAQFIARDMSTSWLPQAQLVPALVAALGSAEGDAASNISQLLVSLVHAGKGVPTAFAEPEEEARAACASVVASCLGQDGATLSLPSVEVVLALLNRCQESAGEPGTSLCADALIDAFAEHVDAFFAALAAPAALPPASPPGYKTPSSTRSPARKAPSAAGAFWPAPRPPARRPRYPGAPAPLPLPSHPFPPPPHPRLVELFDHAIRSEHPAVVQAVGELGYFHVLLDLLLLPHTNNALHLVCTACVDRVVASTSDESQPLREALLGDAELPSRLVSLLSELDAEGVATNGGASARARMASRCRCARRCCRRRRGRRRCAPTSRVPPGRRSSRRAAG